MHRKNSAGQIISHIVIIILLFLSLYTLRFFERFLSIKHPTQLLTKTAKPRVNRLIGFPFSFIPVERQLKKLKNKRSKKLWKQM